MKNILDWLQGMVWPVMLASSKGELEQLPMPYGVSVTTEEMLTAAGIIDTIASGVLAGDWRNGMEKPTLGAWMRVARARQAVIEAAMQHTCSAAGVERQSPLAIAVDELVEAKHSFSHRPLTKAP